MPDRDWGYDDEVSRWARTPQLQAVEVPRERKRPTIPEINACDGCGGTITSDDSRVVSYAQVEPGVFAEAGRWHARCAPEPGQ